MRQLTTPWTRQDIRALICLEDTGETNARRDILTRLNREHKEYLDRNISKAPQTTPGSPIPVAQKSPGFFLYNGEEVSSIAVQRMENKAKAVFEEYTTFSRSASPYSQIPTATLRRQGQPNPSAFKRKRGEEVVDFRPSAKRRNGALEINYGISDTEFPSATISSTKSVPLEVNKNSKHQSDQAEKLTERISSIQENPSAKRGVTPVEAAYPNVMQSNPGKTVEGEIPPSTPRQGLKAYLNVLQNPLALYFHKRRERLYAREDSSVSSDGLGTGT